MALTKAEMIKKEEEKKKKTEERARKELERQKRKEEREKKEEEKEREKAMEESVDEISDIRDEWAENHYGWDDDNVVNDDWDVVPNPKFEHIPTSNPYVVEDEKNEIKKNEQSKEDGKWKETLDKGNKAEKIRNEPKQLEIPFDYQD